MNKIIVTDLDGTLLRNDKTVSTSTIETLLKFKGQGNKILFASARPPRDAYKYVPEVLRDNPIICYNGACIVDINMNVLYKNEISKSNAIEILKIAKKYNYNNLCFEINDELFSTFDTTPFFGNCENKIVDLEKLEYDNVYKILICSESPINKELLDELSPIAQGIITDNGTLCQIMNKGVSKWSSIQSLLSIENISEKDVIAFGDDYNDYDMIKNAGIGVAMGNAEKEIKDISDVITDSNADDGVANFVKKLLESEN